LLSISAIEKKGRMSRPEAKNLRLNALFPIGWIRFLFSRRLMIRACSHVKAYEDQKTFPERIVNVFKPFCCDMRHSKGCNQRPVRDS